MINLLLLMIMTAEAQNLRPVCETKEYICKPDSEGHILRGTYKRFCGANTFDVPMYAMIDCDTIQAICERTATTQGRDPKKACEDIK